MPSTKSRDVYATLPLDLISNEAKIEVRVVGYRVGLCSAQGFVLLRERFTDIVVGPRCNERSRRSFVHLPLTKFYDKIDGRTRRCVFGISDVEDVSG